MRREERLARILIQEAEENEALWVDYEYEETQAKIDLADIVLEEMCGEIVSILTQIRVDRNPPMVIEELKTGELESKHEQAAVSRTRNDSQVLPYSSSSYSKNQQKSKTVPLSPETEELKA